MPDATRPARLAERLRASIARSYLAAVVERFFALDIFDRSFALAAQAFVALLPLEIVLVGLITDDGPDAITHALGDRFGLDMVSRGAIRQLFAPSGTVVAFSWLALVISLFSAFSLSRRFSRTYAAIFDVPRLTHAQSWRGLLWVAVQAALLIVASMIRSVRRDQGLLIALVALAVLLVLWFVADVAGLWLLVPSAGSRLRLVSAAVSAVGRIGIATWAALYLPRSLSEQAAQFGPIGVTFAIFTYILFCALVYVGAPLLVTTWVSWRSARATGSPYRARTGT